MSSFVRGLQSAQVEARATWDPIGLLSPWQQRLFSDNSEVRVADAGRRAGKTFEFAVESLDLASRLPRARIAFAAKSETDAKELIWTDLLELNAEYQLGGVPRKSTLSFPQMRSSIRVTGAKDPGEAQRRFRGRGFDLVGIDECQLLPWLQDMVQKAIAPALMRGGRNGRLWLGGTPGEVAGVGYWEEIRAGAMPGWMIHIATIYDNPFVIDVEAFLAKRAKELGGWNSPTFQREYLRVQLPLDESSGLQYRYSKALNHPAGVTAIEPMRSDAYARTYAGLPGGRWSHVVSIDLGHARDVSGILVIGVTDAAPGKAWLAEEYLAPRRLLLPDLAREVERRVKQYRPITCVCDEGALGVALADQMRAPPFGLPVLPADKTHVLAGSDAVNAGLSSGALQIHAGSRLAQDLAILRWDPVLLAKGKRKQAAFPHSDLEPCLRYAWPTLAGLVQFVRPAAAKPTRDEREEAEIRRLKNPPVSRLPRWQQK